MPLIDYITNHPARLSALGSLETNTENPIRVDTDRKLIDVHSLVSTTALYGGPSPSNPPKTVATYLASSRALRHPADHPIDFKTAYQKIVDAYKADKDNYPTHDETQIAPFFVRPITAFGYIRHQLRFADYMHGQPVVPHSKVLTPVVGEYVREALSELKSENPLAWYFSVNNVQIKLRSVKLENESYGERMHIDALVQVGYVPPKHARVDLNLGEDGMPKAPGILDVVGHRNVRGMLPKIDEVLE